MATGSLRACFHTQLPGRVDSTRLAALENVWFDVSAVCESDVFRRALLRGARAHHVPQRQLAAGGIAASTSHSATPGRRSTEDNTLQSDHCTPARRGWSTKRCAGCAALPAGSTIPQDIEDSSLTTLSACYPAWGSEAWRFIPGGASRCSSAVRSRSASANTPAKSEDNQVSIYVSR